MGLSIQTETKIDRNKPDLTFLEKKVKRCYIVDAACPFDPRIEKKEKNKAKKFTDLKCEILKMWKNEEHCSSCNWYFGDGFEKYKQMSRDGLDGLGLDGLEKLQKACLLSGV